MDDVQNLPIDIHIGKLVEWLVSRQHTTKDWVETARIGREKINVAIQDMPEHPGIIRLLSGSYINYFHCLKIVEILRETEADSKNILGWYTSQRMKDWQAIVKLYEKGGAGLAESGQLLHRYVAFELPGLKAQAARCLQIQQECDKREMDIQKSAANAHNAYLKQCKQLGIGGEDVRKELIGLLAELPGELDQFGEHFKELKETATFYLDFVAFTCDHKFQDSLSLLRYIIDHGNVTTYEYLHGEPPLSVEDPTEVLLKENTNTNGINKTDLAKDSDGIDFGDDEGQIDFGDDDDGGIDFGDGVKIDWEAADVSTAGITVEESGLEGGVARGAEALSILQNPSTRDKILDDVYELEGFLRQRVAEMTAPESNIVALNMWDDAPHTLQMVSLDAVQAQLSVVQALQQRFNTPKVQQMLLISASHRYVDRLTSSLQQQHKRSVVPDSSLAPLHLRRQEAAEEQRNLTAQTEKLRQAARGLAGELEAAIAAKYGGRPVNIMGVQL